MVPWSELVWPILLSAVLIFVASTLIHVAFKVHNSDYRKLANEDDVRTVIRAGAPAPGMYIMPHCLEGNDKSSPEMARKFSEGPVATIFIRPTGEMKIGPFLMRWFVYTLVVSAIAAYVGRAVLPAGADYLQVFRVVGTASWLAYAWQGPADSIWEGKPWNVTFKLMIDGLIYACLTAGAFGWMWPDAPAV